MPTPRFVSLRSGRRLLDPLDSDFDLAYPLDLENTISYEVVRIMQSSSGDNLCYYAASS